MTKTRFWRSAGIGATVAAAGAYLFDPDRGRSRRARLADQTGAALRKAGERIKAQASYQKGVARGLVHDVTKPFQPPVEVDDETLLQKIRSEAVGRWPGSKQDLEIEVIDGAVTVRGQAPPDHADELIRLIESVDGVRAVADAMSISQVT